MKDLGEATYVLGIRIYRDRSRKLLGLSQSTYIDKVLRRFSMQESKKGFLPMSHGICLSKAQSPSTQEERDRMSKIPYASAIGSIMYAMLCTRPDISYAVFCLKKNIDGIIEVRDESDRNGLSIVIDLKKDVDVQNTLNYFYKNTDLQKNYNYNMVAIKNKRPVCMGIVEILDGYIDHQIDVVTKRSLFDLKKAQERKHIVDGLIKAISILDDVVHTIRHSHDKQDAKKNLQLQYHFTEKQAEAIVMLQLYRLTNTDIVSLEKEKQELETLIQTLNDILNSDQVLRKVIVDELKQIKKQYPSPRLTQIKHEVQEIVIDEEAMILPEDIYVSITRDGYVKRISQRSYKASENIAFGKKDDDVLLDLHFASTLDKLLIFTDKGNYLFIPIHKLEEFKWKELGKHISYFIKVSPEEKMIGSILVKSFALPLYVLLTTRLGQIKRVPLKEFEVARYTKPLKCMNLKKDDQLLQVALTDTNQAIVLTSSLGYVSLYSEDEISILGLKAAGIKAMNLKDDYLVAMNTFDPLHSYSYVLISDQPGIKRMRISDIPSCNRATKGTSIFKSPKTNPIHALDAFVLDTQDQLIIESEQKKENLYIKDYSLSQIGQKPSVIQSMKNETIMHVYDRHSLSTDLYISNQDEKVEKSQPLETTSQQDKHFEPISFDDLFKEDF